MKVRRLALVAAVLGMAGIGRAATFFGPTPYLSAADSPFPGAVIEDFEDGLLNVPGVTADTGAVVGPGPFTDSVDGDDGTIDGSGVAGHSLLMSTSKSVTFTFDAGILGALPTSAGVVWTDVGFVDGGTAGVGPVTLEAFGPGGAPLGSIGPFSLGDGNALGGTAEDRFFGVSDPGGISSIRMSMVNSTDWEVDHVQYVVPEPVGMGLIAVAGILVGRRNR